MDINLGSDWTLDTENSSDYIIFLDLKGGGYLTIDTSDSEKVEITANTIGQNGHPLEVKRVSVPLAAMNNKQNDE